MNDLRLDAVPRPGISTFPIKHQILTMRLSLQSVFRFCRQIYTQPTALLERAAGDPLEHRADARRTGETLHARRSSNASRCTLVVSPPRERPILGGPFF